MEADLGNKYKVSFLFFNCINLKFTQLYKNSKLRKNKKTFINEKELYLLLMNYYAIDSD